MNAYRAVILVTTVIALVVASSFLVLRDSDVTELLSLVIVCEATADIVGTVYVLRLVLADRRRPRSWLLLFLMTGALLVTVGLVPIAALVVLRFAGQPPLPARLGLFLTGMGIVLIGTVPIMKAALFYLVQRDASLDPSDDAAALPQGHDA